MAYPTAEIAAIAVCLVFSAFFSASETALTSLSNMRLGQMLENHPRWNRSLRLWQRNPNGVLTTILIGNNLTNITASAVAADVASQYFSSQGIPIAIGAMTFLLLFTGEITPKTLARSYAETMAPALMYLVLVFYFLFFPLTWLLTLFIKLLFKLFGGRHRRHERVTESDIQYIVSLGHLQGTLDKDKEHLLSSIFEFSDTMAREVMVPRTDLVAVPVDSPYESVLEVGLESGLSRIPVYEESIDKIVGIFYTKNLILPPSKDEKDNFLTSRMRPAVFVPESKKISELLKQFQKDHIHMAIVVDEFGGTGGIVTMEDIIEELLGEIQDEFDTEDERLVALSETSYEADARVNIENLEDAFLVDFPKDRDYESLGGFLLEVAGEVPNTGWQTEYQGMSLHVLEADPQRVIKVRIDLAQPPGKLPHPETPDAEQKATSASRDSDGEAQARGNENGSP